MNFHPISLINTTLKIFSKVLAFRLSKVIDSLIDLSQSTFIRGRCILESIVVVEELFFTL